MGLFAIDLNLLSMLLVAILDHEVQFLDDNHQENNTLYFKMNAAQQYIW